jgi:hypothetical protein
MARRAGTVGIAAGGNIRLGENGGSGAKLHRSGASGIIVKKLRTAATPAMGLRSLEVPKSLALRL